MKKNRRTYTPRIVGDKVMMPADLKRLHKYMLDIEHMEVLRRQYHQAPASYSSNVLGSLNRTSVRTSSGPARIVCS